MSYSVKPGNIFGRIGANLGQGLAEQIPKEVERNRLAQGLEALSQEKGLSRLQQLGRLASLPGVTPQLIQSAGEILQSESAFEGAKRGRGERMPQLQQQGKMPSETIANVPFGKGAGVSSVVPRQEQPTFKMEGEQPVGQPQITPTNPLRPEAQPKGPWTPERVNDEIDYLHNIYPNMSFGEIKALAKENEVRDLAQPETERQKDVYTEEQKDKLNKKFNDYLGTHLEKTNIEGVYKDISGEMLNNAKRVMERQLATNPKATPDDVAFNMAKKLGDLARSKKQMETLAGGLGLSNFFKKDSTMAKLEQYSKIFKDTGNSKEYYDRLISDFHLSPQGAASVAFPVSEGVKKEIGQFRSSPPLWSEKNTRHAQQIASQISGKLTDNDSVLSIARSLKDRDPNFDQTAFFRQLAADQDELRLNPRQRDEIAEGTENWMRSWGDIFVLPIR